jgi:hypothetical protein
MSARLPAFCGQSLDTTQLELIRCCVSRYPGLSLEELAATLCEWMDWQRPNGRLKTRECRDLLQRLQAQGLISLPAPRADRRAPPQRLRAPHKAIPNGQYKCGVIKKLVTR